MAESASFRMLPANKCLHTGHLVRWSIHLGVIMKDKLLFFQCSPKIVFHLYFSAPPDSWTPEELKIISPLSLGVIHGHICVFQQGINIRSIMRINRNADTCSAIYFIAIHKNGLLISARIRLAMIAASSDLLITFNSMINSSPPRRVMASNISSSLCRAKMSIFVYTSARYQE